MKKNGTQKTAKAPAFAARAERAHQRAARNIRTANRASGLPVIVWKNGKVVEEAA